MTRGSTVIQTARLDLVVLPGEFLDAWLAGDRSQARQLVDFEVPDEFAHAAEFIELRRGQVLADPAWEPWSLRAIVLRQGRRMVGSANFHGPLGINDIEASDAAEAGYTIFPEFRLRGYATETCRAMLDWARIEHGVSRFIAGVEPSNGPSLRVIEKLGFVPLGLLLEGEAIFELRFR